SKEELKSFHFFKIARLLGAVERRPLWTIGAEVCEPPLAGDRLNPPSLLAGRGFRAEVQVHRLRGACVLQLEHRAQCGLVLEGLDLAPRGGVVSGDGPEPRRAAGSRP